MLFLNKISKMIRAGSLETVISLYRMQSRTGFGSFCDSSNVDESLGLEFKILSSRTRLAEYQPSWVCALVA